ncbi:non-homologous end-joining DNA ligase [Phaeacidiphilus oryzae]|uniref:non-homologous end-joining DNA ligase n=1 Tax=Phaeacidiphilus oryzae TaxID=348818 RepID=UPI00056A20CE|nr:non-homologous end-joining DNA ligase [Phaeacidiphilus oryzae]
MPQVSPVTPMLAVPGKAPVRADGAGDSGEYAFEVKWDGMRLLAALDGDGGVRLSGRSGADAGERYPELVAALPRVCRRPALLDGEVVAFAEDGRPSFERLQDRMGVRDRARARRAADRAPVTLLLFDLLALDGENLMPRPLRERRAALESLAGDWAAQSGGRLLLPPVWQGDWAGAGRTALRWTAERGLEGVIAKRLDSPYRPGERSREWIKVKHRRSAELRIGGWLTHRGAGESGAPRSVLVGEPVPGGAGLRYAGAVGSGLAAAERRALGEALRRVRSAAPPFADPPAPEELGPDSEPQWARPVLLCEVEYAERTAAGRLRHPVWKGLRGVHQDEPPPY